jgi:predicted TIM-barrel fold metal-dependent hydrolase
VTRPAFPVFDADNHFYEPREALTEYLPSKYKRLVQYVEVNGRTKIALDGVISDYIPNPTFDKVARPGTHLDFFRGNNPDGKSLRELTGAPMDAVPGFREPASRLAMLDELGIDATMMYPTLASLVEERMINDPALTHVMIHALNEWIHDVWTFNYQDRIFTTPVITLPIVEEAVKELDWALARGAKAVLIRPAPVAGFQGTRSFGLPEFDPFWARCQESGVLVIVHSSDSGFSTYLNKWEPGREFLPFQPSAFRQIVTAKRPIEDAVAALVAHGAVSRHPRLRIALIENGANWVPALMKNFQHVYEQMPQEFLEHPVEVFQRNFWVNPFAEDVALDAVRALGADRVLFGSDYPHPEGLALPLDYLDDLAGLPESDVAKIMGGNLAGLMGVDLKQHVTA